MQPSFDHSMAMQNVDIRYLDGPRVHAKMFTVCTILYREESFDRMIKSFQKLGFTAENTEFLAFDNRGINRFDGYSYVRRGVSEAQGRYIIFCHDDVELLECGFDDLCARLAELEEHDPLWSVAGVAGGTYKTDLTGKAALTLHISDKYGIGRKYGTDFPCRAETLDECFFVMPSGRAAFASIDLSGFHFYGADVCLQAEMAGGRTYVISFLLHHHGDATKGPVFREQRRLMKRKYQQFFPGRTVMCTTGPISLD
jgi:hypothetical protein